MLKIPLTKIVEYPTKTKKYLLGIRYYKKERNKVEDLEKKKILFIKIIKRKYTKALYLFGIKIYSSFNLKKCLLDIQKKEDYIFLQLQNKKTITNAELEQYSEEPFLRLDGYKILQQRKNIKFGDKI